MSRVLAVVVIALLLLGGATAVDTAYSENGREYNYTDEEFDPEPAGDWTDLDESNVAAASYFETDQVTVTHQGDELVYGEDYRWNQQNGTVMAVAGGDLDQSSFSQLPQIDYGYHIPRGEQDDVLSLFVAAWDVTPVLLFALMCGLALMAIVRFGGA